MTERKHSAECFEAEDGSGDLMIELPEWVQNAMGAKPGDTLIWTIDEDKGCVTLKKRADDFFDGEGVTDDLMNERDQPPDQDR